MDRSCNAGYNLEHNTFGWIGKTGVRFFVLMLAAMAIVIALDKLKAEDGISFLRFAYSILCISPHGLTLRNAPHGQTLRADPTDGPH